ncbi:MAG: hypothetical protein NT152_07020 [Actinobacteria bacterium]|nr:hypothetical protein [Actinomycetota bacterium]
MVIAKKLLVGLLSFLAWILLSLAILCTSATLALNGLAQSGKTTTSILQSVSTTPKAIDSIFTEIVKGADPKVAAELEKNKAEIIKVITSLTGSAEIQGAIATSLDALAQGVLNGDKSVSIDFSKVAGLVAKEINKAAKSTVVNTKDLDILKPKVIDISKESTVISDIRAKLRFGTYAWVLWAFIMSILFYLKRESVLKKAGRQLLSVGLPAIILPSIAPLVIQQFAIPDYAKDIFPKIAAQITGPALKFGATLSVIGLLFLVVPVVMARYKNRLSETVEQG